MKTSRTTTINTNSMMPMRKVARRTGTKRGEKRCHASAGEDLRPRTASHTVSASMPERNAVASMVSPLVTKEPMLLPSESNNSWGSPEDIARVSDDVEEEAKKA